jgi:uncharacterized protein
MPVMLRVTVKPGARTPGFTAKPDGRIEVRVRERAIEGKANEAARSSLAAALKLPRRCLILVRGDKSRHKSFLIDGLTEDQIRARLMENLK